MIFDSWNCTELQIKRNIPAIQSTVKQCRRRHGILFFVPEFHNLVPVSHYETGEFLFLAERFMIYNNKLDTMPNGLFNRDTFISENERGTMVVPFVDDRNKYYFFNLSRLSDVGLTYSIVDMTLDDGRGDVDTITKNTVVRPPDTGFYYSHIIDVVPNNDCGYWLLLVEEAELDERFRILVFNITAAGLNPTPTVTEFQKGGTTDLQWDYQVSPERDRIAFLTYNSRFDTAGKETKSTLISFLNFNVDNGAVSRGGNPDIRLPNGNWTSHGIFTPDNRYFIACNNEYENGAVIFHKYDFSARYTGYNPVTLNYTFPYDEPNPRFFPVFYVPVIINFKAHGNTIYFNLPSTYWKVSIEPGQYELHSYNAQKLGSMTSDKPIWNEIKFNAEIPLSKHTRLFTNNAVPFPYTFRDTIASTYFDSVFCFEPGIPFPQIDINAKPGFTNYVWNDGTTGPSRRISEAGKYWVYYNGPCNTRVDTFVFRFREAPPVLGPDTTLCEQRFPLNFNIKAEGTYLWDDLSANAQRWIYNPGTYFVTFDFYGCKLYDTINVSSKFCPCDINIPTAFSPNGDGLNDYFKPMVALGCAPSKYSFRIFNRWGQQVFSAFNEFDQGWDGTINGSKADIGTYYFEVRFNTKAVENGYVQKGSSR